MDARKLATWGGALGIGILGSAMWEGIKPLLNWLSSLLLTVATLGISSYRDSIYKDAAVGIDERASGITLLIALSYLFALPIARLINEAEFASLAPDAEPDRQSERRGSSLKTIRVRKIIRIMNVLFAFIIVVIGNREIYVSRTSAYARQLQDIAAPFLDDQASKTIRSRFAQVRTKKEFIELVEVLKRTIRKKNAYFPERSLY
ncbi:MAG: hypothetical protein ACK41W_15020 [Cyanobacteriota bacterium]|jgi:hypothetical protein